MPQNQCPTLESETAAQGGCFFVVEDVNCEETRRVLSELHVDLMILGGVPIVKAPILDRAPHWNVERTPGTASTTAWHERY